MKFTWGHGILITLALIVIGFSTALIRSFDNEHQLVTDDYYAKELAFQEQIDKQSRAIKDARDVTYQLGDSGLEISWLPAPTGAITGEVSLIRPSDADQDVIQSITLNQDGVHTISQDLLISGRYQLQVNWQENGSAYYREHTIYIP